MKKMPSGKIHTNINLSVRAFLMCHIDYYNGKEYSSYFVTYTYFLLVFFLIYLFYLFIIFVCVRVFVVACGPSLVAASRGYSLLRCAGFSLWWLLWLWSMGSRHAGLVAPWHVGSSRTRAQTHVPCIGRWILNH